MWLAYDRFPLITAPATQMVDSVVDRAARR
jgi:hypothetical protein